MRAFISLCAAIVCACGGEDTTPIEPDEETVLESETSVADTEEPAAEPAVAEPAVAEGAPPEVESPYEEGVDADEQIAAAVARAHAENKHVLLIFGANWCSWCRRLEHVLRNEPRIAAAIRDHWYVVHVDTGVRRSGVNAEVVARYGDPVQHGLPVLVVLDGEGALVHTQETGSLENGDRHDPERVLAFLNRFPPS